MRCVLVAGFAFVCLMAFGVGIEVCRAAESAPAATPSRPPNVVLFVADDQGLDAGCYGSKLVRTPHLDQLASEGTLFRNAFCTTSSCSPSRSVILTGRHNHATGQYGLAHGPHHFIGFDGIRSLPVMLAEHGYRTAQVGKLHVLPEPAYRFETRIPSPEMRNTVAMADACRSFIGASDAPFFIYFCGGDPHRSAETRPSGSQSPNAFGNSGKYPGVETTSYDPAKVDVPAWLPDTPACRAELAQYYEAITRLDQGLGRLVQVLKESGKYDDTLIVYCSDNGPPFPGAKTTLYEPGMRLPLVVRSPRAARRGVVSEACVSWVDITPTILDFAGTDGRPTSASAAQKPTQKPAQKPAQKPQSFHGRSFRSALDSQKPDGWDEVFASHTFHEVTMYYPMRVVRSGRFKLIVNLANPLPFPFAEDLFESATWQEVLASRRPLYGKRTTASYVQRPRYELYDLEADPDEIHNLADKSEHRAKLEELQAKIVDFQRRTEDPWLVKQTRE